VFIQLAIGTFMIGAIVILHAVSLDFTMKHLRRMEIAVLHRTHRLWKPLFLSAAVLCVFTIHVAEIWIWAFLLMSVSALPDFETALYFSTTAFTTVGFGDVVPAHEWRLLGSIEAANGFMLFAWSAAFTFEILSRLYKRESDAIRS
jgi:hypothetical protein